MKTCPRALGALFIFLLLTACSTSTSTKLHSQAAKYNFRPIVVQTSSYELTGFYSSKIKQDYLNIYLAGDGRPWINGVKIAKNPTGASHLALTLMNEDPTSSIYLGRPCYGKDKLPQHCDETLWTSHRYSNTVVNALNEGLESLKTRFDIRYFNLFGYSGGGSLAVLVAAHRKDVKTVVSIAANLDHRGWTSHFGYDALEGSQNAIDVFPLNAVGNRWHLLGEKDDKVPPYITINAAKQDSGAIIRHYPSFNHTCCWQQVWKSVLVEVLKN